ncbi:MAG: hypothetical protein JWQ81_5940 [Amycolatopsis sp.]|jgi:hypothetical protein|nr:hypothetical protein [Amycolatopsis sp.]
MTQQQHHHAAPHHRAAAPSHDGPLPGRDPGAAFSTLGRLWPSSDDLQIAERRAAFEDARPDIPVMQRVLDALHDLDARPSTDSRW